ncbi:MAG: hypothetical protein AAF577_02755 [Pseudomonadota bacterium]
MSTIDRRRMLYLLAWIYALLALGINVFWQERDVFPIFNWSLFSVVTDNNVSPTLMIHRIDDLVFDEPMNFFDLGAYFPRARSRDVKVVKLIRRYRADVAVDPTAGPALIRAIEQRFLAGYDRVDYSLETWRYDALERFHHGRINERILHYTGSTVEDPS